MPDLMSWRTTSSGTKEENDFSDVRNSEAADSSFAISWRPRGRIEIEAFDRLQLTGHVFDRARQPARGEEDEEQLDHGETNDHDHHQPIGLLQRADEIVDRRQRDHLPRLTEATRKIGEGRYKILSVRWRLKGKSVGTGPSVLAVSLAHIGIVDISQGCDLERSVLDPNALLLVREGDDLAIVAVGDEGRAARAGSVLVEKARQDVYRDVGRCAADEIYPTQYWNTQKENGETGVWVDGGLGHRECPRRFGGLIAGQEANIDIGGNIIGTDLMGPYVVECAMADP
jgi:hypothetical protein